MEKYLRYRGEFLSRAGIVWRVEILQDSEFRFAPVGELTFEGDEPLCIEWEDKAKEEVLCGSVATLRIESPGDRTYEDLYTIAPGNIRMDVYRNNQLYWSGALDPEFYEEPYERAANYPVSLTFSDFGILDRLKYNLSGAVSIADVIGNAIERSGINVHVVDSTQIGLLFPTYSIVQPTEPVALDDIKVQSANFYDEDGEASTMKEVVEGVLQPLALRMVQRYGKIYIYDLDSLYNRGERKTVLWDGDSSTMGVDKVYNTAIITWSPYAQCDELWPDECWDIKVDKLLTNLCNFLPVEKRGAQVWSYHLTQDLKVWETDPDDVGFTLWTSRKGKGVELLHSDVSYFKIVPQYDGQESEGVAIHFPVVKRDMVAGKIPNVIGPEGGPAEVPMPATPSPVWLEKGMARSALRGTNGSVAQPIFRTKEVALPPAGDNRLLLRITMELLLDVRFNPFESSVDWPGYWDGYAEGNNKHENIYGGADFRAPREKEWEDSWNQGGNFLYVPIELKFRPSGSDDVYVWDNWHLFTPKGFDDSPEGNIETLQQTFGSWRPYTEADKKQSFLCYYDMDDRSTKCGVLGWKKNYPAINPHTKDVKSSLSEADAGQYIEYPTIGGAGGYLWMEVLAGDWVVVDGGKKWGYESDSRKIWDKFQWLLCKLPQLEIINNTQYNQEIEDDDVEYKGTINVDAKEDITIDTICGTAEDVIPTARGAYYYKNSCTPIIELVRAGRKGQVEDLLIGTLFSQYSKRHTLLSGETQINADGLAVYEEVNQKDKLFMLTSDLQDCIADTSESTFVELSPDIYIKEDERE